MQQIVDRNENATPTWTNIRKYNKKEITSLKEHTQNIIHQFKFNNTKVLKQDSNCNNLKLYESL